jgi:hypothetical protein
MRTSRSSPSSRAASASASSIVAAGHGVAAFQSAQEGVEMDVAFVANGEATAMDVQNNR